MSRAANNPTQAELSFSVHFVFSEFERELNEKLKSQVAIGLVELELVQEP